MHDVLHQAKKAFADRGLELTTEAGKATIIFENQEAVTFEISPNGALILKTRMFVKSSAWVSEDGYQPKASGVFGHTVTKGAE